MFSFANMFHLLAYKFACLCRPRLAFTGIFLGPFVSGILGLRLAGILPAISTAALALTALLLLTRARSSGTMAVHG